MPELLSAELIALRERTAALARGPLAALRDDASLTDAERGARVRAASKEAGLYGLTQRDDTPALALLVARETLAIHGVSMLRGLFGAGGGVLAAVGEPLRSTHLLPMLAGDKVAGFAITEPRDTPLPTHATVDGDDLVVTGRKSYVTGGADADFLTALVDVDGLGPSMVVIDTDRPGVRVTRRFSSLDGSHHAAFAFEQVRVPRAHVIGAPGDGRSRALDKISAVRRAVAADCVGTMAWLLDVVAGELQRERKGGAKGAQDRIRLRYGELRAAAYAARSMLYRTARLADAGENVVNETIASKVFASELANRIADESVQLIGGEALVVGHPVERALRRVRAYRLAEGDSDTLYVNLSRGFLDYGLGRI